jgi:hypothetical protein
MSSNDPPLIRIDTGTHRVGFASHNSFFDSDNEHGSDMIEEGASTEQEEGGLKILEDNSMPLDFGDMEDLNPSAEESVDMGADDYDVLT